MLLHFNHSTPHLFTFACPQTMAVAVVERDKKTLHPVISPHLGTLTQDHLHYITQEMTRLCQEQFSPKELPSKVNLPEWLAFHQGDKMLVMHTTSPAFICPLSDDLRVIRPIVDHPPIPTQEVDSWVAKAQHAFDDMKAAILEMA